MNDLKSNEIHPSWYTLTHFDSGDAIPFQSFSEAHVIEDIYACANLDVSPVRMAGHLTSKSSEKQGCFCAEILTLKCRIVLRVKLEIRQIK